MRTIGVVTVSRSDYGIYLPLLRAIQTEPTLRLRLIAGGMHLASEFGQTIGAIEADDFEISNRIDFQLVSDTPKGIVQSIGVGICGYAKAFSEHRPDLLVVLGDRFEMYAAALAALPFKIPIAHFYGGELTEGAMDDALRHSMTKLSHLHFVSTREYAQRVIQMGEEPRRVFVIGSLGLDNREMLPLLTSEDLAANFGIQVLPNTLLVTFHSVTLEHEQTECQINELLSALDQLGLPVIFTAPNADTNNSVIRQKIKQFAKTHPFVQMIDNLGVQAYFSLMTIVAAMAGNSSSGIVEAPSFQLPCVNIGTRQQGRLRTRNVIDVGYGRTDIIQGIQKAVNPKFRESLKGLTNPYCQDNASMRAARCLKEIVLDDALIRKRFHDIEVPLSSLVGISALNGHG